MAVAIWDDLIERFGKDSDPDVQMQVANALTKKAAAQMKMEQLDAAVAASDEAIARYGAADRHDLRRELATALELKAMILNQMGRGLEAIEACDVLVRDFGSIAGQREISVRWRAMGSRIHALILEREESAAVRVFRRMCDDLDVADGEMVGYIVWHTIDVIAAGATPGVFADALADAAEDCESLLPLVAALQRLAGRPAIVPKEFEKVVGDVVRKIEDRRK